MYYLMGAQPAFLKLVTKKKKRKKNQYAAWLKVSP